MDIGPPQRVARKPVAIWQSDKNRVQKGSWGVLLMNQSRPHAVHGVSLDLAFSPNDKLGAILVVVVFMQVVPVQRACHTGNVTECVVFERVEFSVSM